MDGEESQEQVVKKLVRYALACEFQRLPIRRAGISEKGLYKVLYQSLRADINSDHETTGPFQESFRPSPETAQAEIWHGNDRVTRERKDHYKGETR